MKAALIFQKIGFTVILISTFCIPLFFLPFTSEFYEFNKNFLFVTSTLLAWVCLCLTFVFERQVRIVRSPLGLPLLLIPLAWLISTLIQTPNKLDAFLEPGQTGTYIAITLWLLATINLIKTKKQIESLVAAILLSSITLGLLSIIWGTGLPNSLLPQATSYLRNPIWTPSGSPLYLIIFLVATGLFATIFLLKIKGSKVLAVLLSLTLLTSLAGSGTIFYHLLNPADGVSRPLFLSYTASWAIALEAMKSSPLLGTGPSTFLSDFNRFRPLSYNQTPNWNLKFVSSGSYWLQILTTVGVIGLVAQIFLVYQSYKLVYRSFKLALTPAPSLFATTALAASITGFSLLLVQIFIPINFLVLVSTFFFLAIAIASLKQVGTNLVHETSIEFAAAGPATNAAVLPWGILLLSAAFSIAVLYFGFRAYWAETLFQKAIVAASKNESRVVYETLIKAMSINPYVDSYRSAYSQINLLLANALAANRQLSETERNTITQLVQQAIREAKNAVALNPYKAANAENLANLYRNLLNFAAGADAWAIASYRQAIILDPINPNLRIALGGILYSLKNYDEAIRIFQQAIDLKPDWANSYYNMAASYREKGDLQHAITVMEKVVTLVDKNSADYAKASAELEDLRKKLGQKNQQQPARVEPQTQLTTPQPLEPKITPPLNLDQSLSPEIPATPAAQP